MQSCSSVRAAIVIFNGAMGLCQAHVPRERSRPTMQRRRVNSQRTSGASGTVLAWAAAENDDGSAWQQG